MLFAIFEWRGREKRVNKVNKKKHAKQSTFIGISQGRRRTILEFSLKQHCFGFFFNKIASLY